MTLWKNNTNLRSQRAIHGILWPTSLFIVLDCIQLLRKKLLVTYEAVLVSLSLFFFLKNKTKPKKTCGVSSLVTTSMRKGLGNLVSNDGFSNHENLNFIWSSGNTFRLWQVIQILVKSSKSVIYVTDNFFL